ncbi:MAG TPA: spore germination protein [Clostridiaceae bacterium]
MKNAFLKKILTPISYKNIPNVKEFYIPEVNENAEKSKENLEKEISVSGSINDNLNFIKTAFNFENNKDIIIREFKLQNKKDAFIAYLDGMVDRNIINNFILRPLMNDPSSLNTEDSIFERVIETNQAKKLTIQKDVIYGILTGDTAVYLDGKDYYVLCETKGFEKRAVDKPHNEAVIKGSQEAFSENLRTNITLIRKIIKNNNLTTEFLEIGDENRNLCAITYLKGIINPAIVDEVKRRINGIKTDFINGSGMLEQFIEDSPMSIIPTVLSTERPDVVASHIVEGKISIIAEGTPFAIIVPITISALLVSPEDSALRWQYGTLLRIIRIIALFLATLLPGIYIAITTYHQEMIPTELLLAIAIARENVPFPTIVEILLMEFSFELIREAGVRIPGMLGTTIGIIGVLVVGQASVQADLVSPVLIVIIATTGLANYTIPDFSFSTGIRIIRLFFIILGAFLGFYGISIGIVILLSFLVDMKSFGVPFLSISIPKTRKSFNKFIKYPIWKQELRPDEVNPLKLRRQPKVSRRWIQENPKSSYDRKDEDE